MTIISDRLKYPYFHNTSDRPNSTINIKTAIASNLSQKAIALNINILTPQAIAPQQTNNTKQRSPLISSKKRSP
ncbi:MAG: hypothetical protein M1G31_22420 [Pseudanabaena sp. Salubria-1]|nr:hypothetical protein [Pseudanabaena sp. Salubria-1]